MSKLKSSSTSPRRNAAAWLTAEIIVKVVEGGVIMTSDPNRSNKIMFLPFTGKQGGSE
jgi:hypothetical protein